MMKKLLLPFLIGCVSLSIQAQQAYYNDVNLNLNGTDLRDELATKITNTHTNTLSYNEAREALKITDLEPGQNTFVYLLYGFSNNTCETTSSDDNDHRRRNKEDFGGGATCEWNREHTYPKSLGNPNLGTSGPGADAHHLRASDVQRNGSRGSKPFSSGSGNSGDSNGGWYPGDEWKGDVARMMMYMYLRYGNQCLPSNVANGSTNSVDSNMVNLLLQWNAEDPVSEYEDQRNEYLGNTSNQYGQGNRNPFIDNPYLATRIWGGPNAEDRWGSSTNDTEAPSAPSSLQNTSLDATSAGLAWSQSTDNVGVTGYDVYVNGTLNTTVTTTETTISSLTAATEYSFYVIAKDAAGNTSQQSNTITVTTLSGGGGNTNNGTCVNESFENIPDASSSYITHTWTGDDNIQWTSTQSRTDQNLNQRAITIRREGTLSATTTGGISNFSVTTKRIFSGGSGTFDLLVNGTKVGEIPYSSDEETTNIDNINITGNVTISIENNSEGDNRVMFDDLTWKCYATASVKENTLANVSVYPNPSKNGNVFVTIPAGISVDTVKVYSVLGKEVYKHTANNIEGKIKLNSLKSGLYLLKISNKNQSITKKIIVN